MKSSSPPAGKLSVRELTLLPLMGALIFAAKEALYALPNININAVLIILCAIFFGWKGMFSVGIYVMLEGLVNGFSIWWFGYLYTWPLVLAAAMTLRSCRSALIWAVFAAVYGLLFGPLMYLEYFAINGGWEMFLTMWVSGIPYDLAHCGGNFVLTLVLFQPLYRVMTHFLGDPDKKESP